MIIVKNKMVHVALLALLIQVSGEAAALGLAAMPGSAKFTIDIDLPSPTKEKAASLLNDSTSTPSLTIHWHGIIQFRTNYDDGPDPQAFEYGLSP